MLFKMTIFWTIVIVTHVTVNWIVLGFPTTSTAGRRHIHCVYVLSYVFAWLKVLKTHYGATNSNIILLSLSYHFFQHLGTSRFPYLLFLFWYCGIRTPVISGFGGTKNYIGALDGFWKYSRSWSALAYSAFNVADGFCPTITENELNLMP